MSSPAGAAPQVVVGPQVVSASAAPHLPITPLVGTAHSGAGSSDCGGMLLVQLLLFGHGQVAHMASACMITVPRAKSLDHLEGRMLWNSEEPIPKLAGVLVTMGPQLRQQVPGRGGCKIPGVI